MSSQENLSRFQREAKTLSRLSEPHILMILNEPHENFVKIVDFGLAKVTVYAEVQSQALTRTGDLLGSLHYMSPPLFMGMTADSASDIYALGCLFYEILTGQPPFDAVNPVSLMGKHASETLRPASKLVDGIAAPIG